MTTEAWAAAAPTPLPSPRPSPRSSPTWVATAAVNYLLALCRQFALPEPTRIDHQRDAADGAVSVVAQWPVSDDECLILTLDDREHSAPRHCSGELERMRDVAGPGRVLLHWPMQELHQRPLLLLDRLRRLGIGIGTQR